jgi:ribonuclease HI
MTRPDRTLTEILSEFGIKSKDWDWLIVSDGSGSTWQRSAGWCGILIHQHSARRHVFSGSLSYGTSNLAEILGVFHSIWYLSDQERQPSWQQILVLTDSQYVAQMIEKPSERVKSHAALWKTIWAAKRDLLNIKAQWIPRASIALNQLADAVAGETRLRQKNVLQEAIEKLNFDVTKLSQINPKS